ncbi:MAG: zf-HC2 domain-containing protein [Acidobacteriota bacterium]
MNDPSSLETALRRLGDATEEPSARAEVDAELLAAWLDGELTAAESERIEVHLASDEASRALAADVAGAMTEARRAARWRPLLATAAVVLVAFGGWWLATWDARLSAAGVPALARLSQPDLVADARRALAGDWPRPGGFENLEDPGGRSLLRGADAPRVPRPLAPRWSAVRSPTPRLRLAPAGVERVRLLVVDADENVVAMIHRDIADASASLAVDWPPDRPALGSGLYAWSVGVDDLDLAATSEWVPFRVLSVDDLAAIDRQVGSRDGLPAALILARAGLLDEAEAALASIDDPAVRDDLLDGLDALRRLPPEVRQVEERGRSEAGR